MAVSWVDFSIADNIKPFSLSLEKDDFLFLAGETCHTRLLRTLAGFLQEGCNSADSIRIDGQRIKNGEMFNSVLLPKDAVESFPPHRTIGAFALDLTSGITKKQLENHAAGYGIDRRILYSKPSKISPPGLQKISLWLCSLNASAAIFIEEPECGFFDECRPFDFLQGLLRSGVTDCIVYLASKKESILQKSKILQFCRARVAVFCADRLVEEGEAVRILENPVHSYTREWLRFGSRKQIKNGTLWLYCRSDCTEQHSCSVRQSVSSVMWDCEPPYLHKVVCKGFWR